MATSSESQSSRLPGWENRRASSVKSRVACSPALEVDRWHPGDVSATFSSFSVSRDLSLKDSLGWPKAKEGHVWHVWRSEESASFRLEVKAGCRVSHPQITFGYTRVTKCSTVGEQLEVERVNTANCQRNPFSCRQMAPASNHAMARGFREGLFSGICGMGRSGWLEVVTISALTNPQDVGFLCSLFAAVQSS